MKNVIILTLGLAGSSVLAGLFPTQGYWVGDSTKKKDYDTWENSDLVDLNKRILNVIGLNENWAMEFKQEYFNTIASNAKRTDHALLPTFLDSCNQHEPWVWKDPRLWLTIRLWLAYLDKSNTCFFALRRNLLQSWISTTLRRQIQTYRYSTSYLNGIHSSIIEFLTSNRLDHAEIVYEDILLAPDKVLEKINQLAGTKLAVRDLESKYRGKLYKRQHGPGNFMKAAAIYLKNYKLRYR